MNKDQAIKILIQAVELATVKGAYQLQEAKAIGLAVDILKQNNDTNQPVGDNTATGDIEG